MSSDKHRHLTVGIVTLASLFSLTVLANPADSVSAPGLGIIPSVSAHYKQQPAFYDFNNMPAEQITPNIRRRFIMGTQSSMTRWDIKAGTDLPLHFHVNEQILSVKEGELESYSQGQKYTIKPGQVMIFPPNVPHQFKAVKDTTFIEVHTPGRQDFINGDFEKTISKLAR